MRIRFPRALRSPLLRLIPILLAAACDGGETAVVPQLHELRVSIVSGRGMVDTVRTPGLAAGSEQLVPRPVVAQVYAVLDEDAGTPITEPSRRVDLPPVTIQWRTLQSWCAPLVTSSTAGADGTASNQLHRATVALPCQLVAEALVDGQVFDADTATIIFKPGPIVSFSMPPVIGHLLGFGATFYRSVGSLRDAYGNTVEEFTATGQLLSGSPPFLLQDTLVISPVEATGTLRVTVGQVSRDVTVWALADLRGSWRLEWACHDLPPADAGGAHTDSVRYRLDAEMRLGGLTGRGLVARLEGTLSTRTWLRGQPLSEATSTGQVRFAAQRPGVVEWSPGQAAVSAGDAYAGGSLCEPLADGRAWARFTPARMVRR